jgi:glucose-6-phosphate isomerase
MERWQDPEWVKRMAINLDFNSMMADVIGAEHGITREEINSLMPRTSVISADLDRRRQSNELGFYKLPYDVVTVGNLVQRATALRKNCEDFVVLGIGGSALGGIALFRSLCHPSHNLLTRRKRNGVPRIFFLDNIDPGTFQAVLDTINLEKTIFNVITKSGTTTETISQFLIVRDMLIEKIGTAAVKDHIIVTTDDKANPLRTIAQKEGYEVLDIPENVGGRFSVFSTVGLFPSLVAGIDVEELLAGAWYMEQRCRTENIWQNPAYMAGVLHYLADTQKNLNVAVMMPYSDALYQVAFWFRQLWAESLGKARDISGNPVHCGQTPVAALGTTDQHSQLQLYMEGPYNKMITFLTVKNHGSNLSIRSETEKTFRYLNGHDLGEIFNIEWQATQAALTAAGRNNMSLILPEINPFTVGQLLFMLEVQTVFTGGLYSINPLDQPGVQASKAIVTRMLSHLDYEKAAASYATKRPGESFII